MFLNNRDFQKTIILVFLTIRMDKETMFAWCIAYMNKL